MTPFIVSAFMCTLIGIIILTNLSTSSANHQPQTSFSSTPQPDATTIHTHPSPPSLDHLLSTPSYTFTPVTHRYLVGFHAYALAEDHETTLRTLRSQLPTIHQVEEECVEIFPFTCHSQARVNSTMQHQEQCASIVGTCTHQPLPLDWQIIQRTNPGSSLPTDFLLVELKGPATIYQTEAEVRVRMNEIWTQLKQQHPKLIKYVTEEKRVTRSLMEFIDQDTELDDELDEDTSELNNIFLRINSTRKVRTTLDLDSSEEESTFEESSSSSPSEVGDFPPPQRFDLAHGLVSDDSNSPNPNSTPLTTSGASIRRKLCQWGSGGGNSPTELLKASKIWSSGFKGAGIRIAIFDTGLSLTHPHFQHIDERTNWTDEQTLEDGLGHGTFVAGVIASGKDCLGFAPEASLHVFRVFNQRQLSFTSWFLDAFNYAIHSRVHILNLSIGGPDFLDRPFVEKVNEMSANGITVVSAIGNDGPLWGTLNNPADQMDVIGVGGMNEDYKMSTFSSRGMTTAELPAGYGRMKPDLVALARNIRGSNQGSGCKTMSGTSVASPVVAGCVTLLASVIPESERQAKLNPAFLKQLLLETTTRLPNSPNGKEGPGIFEQGEGSISLENAFHLLTDSEKSYITHASIVPSKLDLTDCPYMSPYCTQPIYYSSMAVLLNLTILNSQSVSSFIPHDGDTAGGPKFHPADNDTKDYLRVRFSYPESFWPWSGWFGIHLTLSSDIPQAMTLSGYIEIPLESEDDTHFRSIIKLPLKIAAIPTPPRSQRILFDAFHNLRYPSGYFPRDNLEIKMDTLDWNGDHIHTNYRELYAVLRDAGYYVEVLGRDYTCFDSSLYSTLLLIDPEEEYFIEEIQKLQDDIYLEGLNLLLMADWYNTRVMREIKFYDENTAEWWTPETGGANVPALNSLLRGLGMELSDIVVKGDIHLAGEQIYFASGTTLTRFPASGMLFQTHLTDGGSGAQAKDYPIMGAYAPATSDLFKQYEKAGRVVVYGDSNCVDMNHRRGPVCAAFILDALQYLNTGDSGRLFKPGTTPLSAPFVDTTRKSSPKRAIGNNLIKYSKVTSAGSAPQCPIITVETESQVAAAPLTPMSVYEQIHTAANAATQVSGDEQIASNRFNSAIKKMKKKRKWDSPTSDSTVINEESTQSPSNPSSSPIDPNKPAPVLTKQGNFPKPGDSEIDPQQTAQLFAATSPSNTYSQRYQLTSKDVRDWWMRLGLVCVLICIALVGVLFRRQIQQQAALAGKHSPQQTPVNSPRSAMQPRPMLL